MCVTDGGFESLDLHGFRVKEVRDVLGNESIVSLLKFKIYFFSKYNKEGGIEIELISFHCTAQASENSAARSMPFSLRGTVGQSLKHILLVACVAVDMAKSNGQRRICGDYRTMNKHLRQNMSIAPSM